MAYFKDLFVRSIPVRAEKLKVWEPSFLDDLLRTVSVEDELREELEGIIEEIGPEDTNLSHQELLRLSLIGQMKYELGATQSFNKACTGILAAMTDGTMVHGRNMDLNPKSVGFGKGAGVMEAVFTRHGRVAFKGPTFFGAVGISTGVVPGAFSVEQNSRSAEPTRNSWNDDLLLAAREGGRPQGYVLRRLLQDGVSYNDAVGQLSASKWLAPGYFVVAGARAFQGAVVTVGRVGEVDGGGPLDVQAIDPARGVWFLVQTNDDNWEPPKDIRRPVAKSGLAHRGRKRVALGVHGSVWKAIRQFPVCNPSTWFSWIVLPSSGASRLTGKDCGL